MAVYIITAIDLLLFALVSEIKAIKNNGIFKTILLGLGCFQLFFITGFRLNTGYDYPAYARMFINSIKKPLSELAVDVHEKGYLLLSRYIQLFTKDFQVIFLVTAFFTFILIGIILYKYSPNPSLGLLFFYLFAYVFAAMCFVRNMFAAVICLFIYKYIREKSFLRYLTIVLLASTFHFSALFMIPFYFILKIKFNYITLAVYTVIGGILFAFSNPIMLTITKYIYTAYNPENSPHMFNGIPLLYMLLILTGVFIPALLMRKEIEKESPWKTTLISASFFGLYFTIIATKHSILGRFGEYFGPIVVLLLLPEIFTLLIRKIKNKEDPAVILKVRNYACLSMICISVITFFTFALFSNYNGVVPHQWIWNL